jgi:hypothetical protein
MMRFSPFRIAVLAVSAAVATGHDKPAASKGAKMDRQEMNVKMEKVDGPASQKKGGFKFAEEARAPRDAEPITAAIDQWVDAALGRARIPASAQADEAEFLRRVTLDIIGRIPTPYEASAFFQSTDPEKHGRWINDLLASPAYGDTDFGRGGSSRPAWVLSKCISRTGIGASAPSPTRRATS